MLKALRKIMKFCLRKVMEFRDEEFATTLI